MEKKYATLIEFYKIQWADIHHTRNQDWHLSRLIIVGLLGTGGLKLLESANSAAIDTFSIAFDAFFLLMSILAVAVTNRHRVLFKEKMEVIRKVEDELKISRFDFFPKKTVPSRQKLLSTQAFLIILYCFFSVLFLVALLRDILSM